MRAKNLEKNNNYNKALLEKKAFFASSLLLRKTLGKMASRAKKPLKKQPNGKAFFSFGKKALGKEPSAKPFAVAKVLGKESYGRAQVAIEHLTVTAAVLAMVVVAFAFGFVTFDQNIKIAKARDALTALVSTANEVYTLGKGNTRFTTVSFPSGLPDKYITIVNLCNDGTNLECTANPVGGESNGNEETCDCITMVRRGGGYHYGIKTSAIKIKVGLIGGETGILREAKAKLILSDFPIASWAANGSPYTIMVMWPEGSEKIVLQRV